jgi:hypothetical protein
VGTHRRAFRPRHPITMIVRDLSHRGSSTPDRLGSSPLRPAPSRSHHAACRPGPLAKDRGLPGGCQEGLGRSIPRPIHRGTILTNLPAIAPPAPVRGAGLGGTPAGNEVEWTLLTWSKGGHWQPTAGLTRHWRRPTSPLDQLRPPSKIWPCLTPYVDGKPGTTRQGPQHWLLGSPPTWLSAFWSRNLGADPDGPVLGPQFSGVDTQPQPWAG